MLNMIDSRSTPNLINKAKISAEWLFLRETRKHIELIPLPFARPDFDHSSESYLGISILATELQQFKDSKFKIAIHSIYYFPFSTLMP